MRIKHEIKGDIYFNLDLEVEFAESYRNYAATRLVAHAKKVALILDPAWVDPDTVGE